MGIFARLAKLLESNLNDIINGAEEPEKMLNQVVVDMQRQLLEAKQQVAAAIVDEKRLMKQAEQEATNAAEWERRAMLAVRAGDDALAKEALARKKEHEVLRDSYQDQWQKQKAAVDQLKLALRALAQKIEAAKRKKDLLIARKNRAEAQKKIQETVSGIKNASAFETFDRMAKKVDQLEAEAEAHAEMNEEATGDVLLHKLEELERTHGAEEDLLALKQKMGLAPTPPAQPVRVEAPLDQAEQEELARALAELEAEENAQLRGSRKP
jgi:phage shock protein A